MPLTPEDVSNKRFTPVRLREGYDMGEVDQFLDEVEAELARLTKENDDLRSKLSAAQTSGSSSAAPTSFAPVVTPEPEREPELTPAAAPVAHADRSLSAIFNRLEQKDEPVAKPVAPRAAFLGRLGKR